MANTDDEDTLDFTHLKGTIIPEEDGKIQPLMIGVKIIILSIMHLSPKLFDPVYPPAPQTINCTQCVQGHFCTAASAY